MTTTTDPVKKIEQAWEKLQRARDLVAADKIIKILGRPNAYAVESSSSTGVYVVQAEQSCSCPDFQYRVDAERHRYCKHLLAVHLFTGGILVDDVEQGEDWEEQENQELRVGAGITEEKIRELF